MTLWTRPEIAILRRLRPVCTDADIAHALKRTRHSVAGKIRRLRLGATPSPRAIPGTVLPAVTPPKLPAALASQFAPPGFLGAAA